MTTTETETPFDAAVEHANALIDYARRTDVLEYAPLGPLAEVVQAGIDRKLDAGQEAPSLLQPDIAAPLVELVEQLATGSALQGRAHIAIHRRLRALTVAVALLGWSVAAVGVVVAFTITRLT